MSDREINAIDFIYKIEYNITYGAVMITVDERGRHSGSGALFLDGQTAKLQ